MFHLCTIFSLGNTQTSITLVFVSSVCLSAFILCWHLTFYMLACCICVSSNRQNQSSPCLSTRRHIPTRAKGCTMVSHCTSMCVLETWYGYPNESVSYLRMRKTSCAREMLHMDLEDICAFCPHMSYTNSICSPPYMYHTLLQGSRGLSSQVFFPHSCNFPRWLCLTTMHSRTATGRFCVTCLPVSCPPATSVAC